MGTAICALKPDPNSACVQIKIYGCYIGNDVW